MLPAVTCMACIEHCRALFLTMCWAAAARPLLGCSWQPGLRRIRIGCARDYRRAACADPPKDYPVDSLTKRTVMRCNILMLAGQQPLLVKLLDQMESSR